MTWHEVIMLKNGLTCVLRNGTEDDGQAVLENFNLTHEETDFLLSYPWESAMTVRQECDFLREKTKSDHEIEIIAIINGAVAGTAGISAVGEKYKVRHRAEFGISIAKEFWGLGIGTALMDACIQCAKAAGYHQLELDVVAENTAAIALYKKAGFVEYGRNPRGFRSCKAGFQELVLMRMELQ